MVPTLTLEGHRDWQLAVLNGEVHPSDDDIWRRFSNSFLTGSLPVSTGGMGENGTGATGECFPVSVAVRDAARATPRPSTEGLGVPIPDEAVSASAGDDQEDGHRG